MGFFVPFALFLLENKININKITNIPNKVIYIQGNLERELSKHLVILSKQ